MPDNYLRHVVLFSFNDDASEAEIHAVEQAFSALPAQIPGIAGFEWGTDASVENLAQGFTHCFLVSFRTTEARDSYLPHPAHQAFVAKLQPILDRALVIDYWRTL